MKRTYKFLLGMVLGVIVLLNSFSVYADNELVVNAKAALIVETNTGKIIYEKNSKEKEYPASVTKILTAIIAIEKCDLNDVATVSQRAVSQVPSEYVVAPLYVGEQIRVEDLLYALMLKSSNDAAYVLAEHIGGSVEGFSDIMNKKAEEIGCNNSHFVNPNGIDNLNHYTSAYDLYLITNYALKNETFAKIVSTYQYTLPATNKNPSANRVMKNTNLFVNPNSGYYNKNVKGVKTGTTDFAGNCLITYTEKDNLDFITVVLGAETSASKFSETKKMIDYVFNNYTYTNLNKKGDVIKSVEVEKATKETKNLDVVVSDEITVLNNTKTTVDNIVPEIKLNDNIVAPISAGQEIGTIKYNVDGIEYSAKLLAKNDVERQIYYNDIVVIGGVVVIVVILIVVFCRKKKKK